MKNARLVYPALFCLAFALSGIAYLTMFHGEREHRDGTESTRPHEHTARTIEHTQLTESNRLREVSGTVFNTITKINTVATLSTGITSSTPDQQVTVQDEGPVNKVMTLVALLSVGDEQAKELLKKELDLLTIFHPELIDELLMAYINLSDQNMKEDLYALLTTITNNVIEMSLLDRLERGEKKHALELLDLLATTKLKSNTSTNRLVTLLHSSNRADETRLILQILYTQGNLKPDERATLLASIVNLSSHSDEGFRAAAVGALPFWETSDTGYIVEHAIQDSSAEVRLSAIRAANAVSNQTPMVQFALMEIATDEQEHNSLRYEAISALAGFSMNPIDKHNLSILQQQFEQHYINPPQY